MNAIKEWRIGDEKKFLSGDDKKQDFMPPRPDWFCVKCGTDGYLTKEQELEIRFENKYSIACSKCGGITAVRMGKLEEILTMD